MTQTTSETLSIFELFICGSERAKLYPFCQIFFFKWKVSMNNLIFFSAVKISKRAAAALLYTRNFLWTVFGFFPSYTDKNVIGPHCDFYKTHLPLQISCTVYRNVSEMVHEASWAIPPGRPKWEGNQGRTYHHIFHLGTYQELENSDEQGAWVILPLWMGSGEWMD